jgi:Icc-related predicted phosphoesterase
MKVCAISDLHGLLPEVPDCDLLLIAGDVCPIRNHELSYQRAWLDHDFRAWLDRLRLPVVGVWGNHDLIGELAPDLVPRLPWTLLQDSAALIDGWKVYGSPWQLRFFDWAFNLDEPDLARHWARIPDDSDILVLHGPPYGYGDLTDRGERVGSPSLRKRIFEVKPALAVFGHIHEGRGRWDKDSVTLANVTVVDTHYEMVFEPMVFEIEKPRR